MRKVLAVLPVLIILASALWLLGHWSALPEQWPVHWGADGRPNGWAQKSYSSAFLPHLVALALWGLMQVAAAWAERGSGLKAELSDADQKTLREALADTIRLCTLSLACVLAFVGGVLQMMQSLQLSPAVPVAVALWMGLTVAGTLAWYTWRTRGVSMPEGYSPLLYRNPQDKRLWVPKLVGSGWTLNFAHPAAIPALIGMVLLIAGLTFAIISVARGRP